MPLRLLELSRGAVWHACMLLITLRLSCTVRRAPRDPSSSAATAAACAAPSAARCSCPCRWAWPPAAAAAAWTCAEAQEVQEQGVAPSAQGTAGAWLRRCRTTPAVTCCSPPAWAWWRAGGCGASMGRSVSPSVRPLGPSVRGSGRLAALLCFRGRSHRVWNGLPLVPSLAVVLGGWKACCRPPCAC